MKNPNQRPRRDWDNGGYVCLWHDGEILRRVRSAAFRETWTQNGLDGDPEVLEREFLPKDRRRELRAIGR